jgi:hypothetical protein
MHRVCPSGLAPGPELDHGHRSPDIRTGSAHCRGAIGGSVDNSELDLDQDEAPQHYPPNTGAGRARYRLHHVGRQESTQVYAVYAAPELADAEVNRVAMERDYARRFAATVEPNAH